MSCLNSNFCIEAATSADLSVLVTLLAELFTLEQDFSPHAEKQQCGLEMLLAAPSSARVLLVRDSQGQAVAMASGQLLISTAEGAYSLWVEDVLVQQAHRGQGLGRHLLQALLDWARQQGATRAQLLADADNPNAIAFYKHLGWQATHLGAFRYILGNAGSEHVRT